MPDVKREQRVISEWVLLQKINGVAVGEIKWLDTPERKGDIDALAQPFAIEHTSVDRLKNQRLHNVQFGKLVKDLDRITLNPPARLSLSVLLDDFLKVNHNELKTAMEQWLRTEASVLEEGHSSCDRIGNIAVRWWCWKRSNRPPRIIIGLAVDVEKNSKDISGLLRQKSNKLRGYKDQSFTTVLIVESSDFQLMAPDVLLTMILQSPEASRFSIDQLWLADTSLNDIEFWRIIPETQHLDGPFNLSTDEVEGSSSTDDI